MGSGKPSGIGNPTDDKSVDSGLVCALVDGVPTLIKPIGIFDEEECEMSKVVYFDALLNKIDESAEVIIAPDQCACYEFPPTAAIYSFELIDNGC